MRIPFLSCLLLKKSQKRILMLFMLILFQISCIFGRCLNDQRTLLLHLNSTLVYDSSLSTKLVQWNHHVDCCSWNGVQCDDFGHVIGLELNDEGIYGGIENSSTLFSFQYLENLNLAYNDFNYTQIPRELGNLTNLARLNFSNAKFAGQIPVELSQMTRLVMLDLSSNLYEDPYMGYPNFKNFVQNLTRLEELYLDCVDFTHKDGWWEALSLSLPNLRSLSLSNCNLSGRLSSSFLQLHSLSILRLDGNDLSDTALEFFENFRNLTILSLRYCSLQGTFPSRIFQVPTLQHLDLYANYNLTGTITRFLPGGSLRTLILRFTNFTGSLTHSIINLSNLSVIDIYDCNFTGPLPSIIGNLSKLVSLNFALNSFTGSIPTFSMSNELEFIDLSNNYLNGSLSSAHFEGLSNLQYLDLSNNSLKGNIPASLFRLPSLYMLQLSDNKFSGQVNEFPTLNSSLMELHLGSNQLEGLIPKSFFRLEKLIILDLSFNFFNGTIHLEDFRNPQNLEYLGLGNNHFSVNISSVMSDLSSFSQLNGLSLASCNLSKFPDLRNQTNLDYLDLSNNKISGDIPSWIWEIGDGALSTLNLSHNFLKNLQTPYQIPSSVQILDLHSNMLHGEMPVLQLLPTYVDYSSNYFHGHIPIDISHNFNFQALFFSVANNNLTGEIPISLCRAVYLQVLDLSGNLFSGVLPPCLMNNLTYLGVLNIGQNNISGNIPDTFPASCSLSTLGLSRNDLQGNIPPSLANCKSLQVLNVASNNFNGTFPCILMNSSSLHVLVLRSNKFFGDIRCPEFNHNRSNLQIIDIALNNFTGFLDSEFISSLSTMKLENLPRFTGDPLSFSTGGEFNYYRDKVTVTLKGLELEIVKILTVFTSIDFSSNKFQGAIPMAFGELSAIYVLNLSHNSFTGTIPISVGNLTHLESLDLSANQLTGKIPTELTSLTSLSVFNVSYNKLVGSIPSERQFLTFSAASYKGNAGLCGFPVNRSCESQNPPPTEILSTTTSSDENDIDWIFMLAGLGYAFGVALVVVPPIFSTRWGERWDGIQFKLLRLIRQGYRA